MPTTSAEYKIKTVGRQHIVVGHPVERVCVRLGIFGIAEFPSGNVSRSVTVPLGAK